MAAISAELKLNIQQFQANLRRAQTMMRTMATRGIGAVAAAGKRLGGVFTSMQAQIGGLVAGFVSLYGAIRGIQFGVGVMSSFEAAIDKVQALSNASAEDMAKLAEEARRLGAATTFSATEAAEGLGFLALAGFNAQQQTASLESVLRLAQAAEMDLGRAAEITAGALGGFGLDAAEAGRVADVLAKTSASAMTDVEQMGQALKFVAAPARLMGMTLEETSAVIGALGNNFLQSGLAGRGLKSVMGQMKAVAPEAVKHLEAVGLAADSLDIQKVGILTALENLSKLDTDALLAIFGTGQLAVAGNLAKAFSSGTFETLLDKLYNSANEARRMSKTMTENLKGDFAILRSTIEETFLVFGDAGILDFSRRFVQDITNGVVIFREAFKAGQLGELVQLALTVAFQNSVNFLLKALAGAIAATGELWTVAFQGALSVFEVIRKPEFWAPVAGIFENIGLKLQADMLRFQAWLVDPFEEQRARMREEGKRVVGPPGFVQDMRRTADELEEQIRENLNLGADQPRKSAAQAMQDALKAFREGFQGTENLFDPSEIQKQLDELSAKLKPPELPEIQRENAGRVPFQPFTEEEPEDLFGGLDLGSTMQALVGSMQAATNLLFGRSANELIAVEARRTNQILDNQTRILQTIESNTRSQPARGVPPQRAVQAVFG